MTSFIENFLPISREDMTSRGWYYYDFLLISGDAYVDHPSFAAAVIGRVLESREYRVAILAQPDFRSGDAIAAMGAPRYGVLIAAGNVDSMVAHYSVAKRRRTKDAYSPGGRAGLRPDRAAIVYSNLARAAFPGTPIICGGIEASLRRFAHYDYWDDKVRRPLLFDCACDMLVFGMGERAILSIADKLRRKTPVGEIRDVRGTCFIGKTPGCAFAEPVLLPSFEDVSSDGRAYARAALEIDRQQDAVRGRALIQPCAGRYLIQNPPAPPLEQSELDAVYDLPYTRRWHPSYDAQGGVPAIEEVKFSIIHNRGCFGGCRFCALSLHQGRAVSSRSHESVLREAQAMTRDPGFKGYIHDVGGPTANFRAPACRKQRTQGACPDRQCLFPQPCPSLEVSHSDYLALLRKLRALEGVKKVFIRSGIRYDYMLADGDRSFFRELVQHHVSGQLKIAPEHISDGALRYMGKPGVLVFDRFRRQFFELSEQAGKEQYLVPYLMSSHPGCTLHDAVELALYLKQNNMHPEQVQDFYPTPGTLSTAMFYTGLDLWTLEPVFVAKTVEEKAMQRALLQYRNPRNRALVIRALQSCGRQDLIGYRGCLVAPGHRDTGTTAGAGRGKSAAKRGAVKTAGKDKKNAQKRSAPKQGAQIGNAARKPGRGVKAGGKKRG